VSTLHLVDHWRDLESFIFKRKYVLIKHACVCMYNFIFYPQHWSCTGAAAAWNWSDASVTQDQFCVAKHILTLFIGKMVHMLVFASFHTGVGTETKPAAAWPSKP